MVVLARFISFTLICLPIVILSVDIIAVCVFLFLGRIFISYYHYYNSVILLYYYSISFLDLLTSYFLYPTSPFSIPVIRLIINFFILYVVHFYSCTLTLFEFLFLLVLTYCGFCFYLIPTHIIIS